MEWIVRSAFHMAKRANKHRKTKKALRVLNDDFDVFWILKEVFFQRKMKAGQT